MSETLDNVSNVKFSDAITTSLRTYTNSPSALDNDHSAETIDKCIAAFENRPLVRWRVLLMARREARAAGINWEGIGDFLVKIAPILIELIKMFL